MIEQLLSPELVHALGWTLVHTLWQAALFALLLGGLLILLRKYSAQARYVVAISLLGAFFVTVGTTFYRLYSPAVPTAIVQETFGTPNTETASFGEPNGTTEAAPKVQETAAAGTAPTVSFQERVIQYYNDHLPLIVTLWLMGVLMLQLRFLGQLAFIQRLKNYGTERFPAHWAGQIQELETALKISKPVRYLTTHRIGSPMVIGWLRPAVLFPPALLEELRESQVVAILAHELAHVKRHDFLVNLLQSLFCTVFFYHPAVWWMSARIEEEREHCCDDLAIEATGQPVGYAKTLLELKETELAGTSLAMAYAGDGKGFKQRITRLLSGYLNTSTYGEGFTTAVIIAGCIALALNLSGQQESSLVNGVSSTNDFEIFHEGEFTIPTEAERNGFGPPPPPPGPPSPLSPEEALALQKLFDEQLEQAAGDPRSLFDLFMQAIYEGQEELVAYFLEKEEFTDLNQTDEHDFTPLMAAASENHEEVVQLLIDAGADVNFVNAHGWTALIEAADEGSHESAIVLIEAGADVNLKGKNNSRSALAMAASEGHMDVFRLLVSNGADVLSMKGGGQHPLHEAAKEGEIRAVRTIIQLGSEVDVTDENGRTPLSYAAEEGQLEVAEALLKAGADAGAKDSEGRTPLIFAAAESNKDIVVLLLQKGANPSEKDLNGHSAIVYATDEGNLGIIKVLMEQGNINLEELSAEGHDLLEIAGDEGHTHIIRYLLETEDVSNNDQAARAFLAAAREGETETVREFLKRGIDPEVKDRNGNTALMLAAREGKASVVRLLLKEITSEASLGPALLLAAREGKYEVVRLLLEKGVDPSVKDRSGRSAYDLAAREGKTSILKLLAENGLDPAELGNPLLMAAREGKLGTVEYLHELGADLNYSNDDGSTAISLAAREGKTAITQYLLENGASVHGSGKGEVCSPIFLAARERQAAQVALLASNGADLESTCSYRDIDYFSKGNHHKNTIAQYENATPLVVAITETDMATLTALIKAGADLEATIRKIRFTANRPLDYRDSDNLTVSEMHKKFDLDYEADGWTPLMEAVESRNSDLVIMLLKNGADRNASTEQGLTAKKLAQQLKLTNILRILE
ncbi:MAG: ankyrin repeat domain-containing protein [Bacteroidota bacterium]